MQYVRSWKGLAVAVGVALLLAIAARSDPTDADTPPMEQVLDAVEALDATAFDAAESEPEAARPTWDLPVTRNERVEFWIDFLTGANRDKTRLWLERSGRYVPMIRAELRSRGMPEDLVYLAMIESGFSPRAYSRAHASGLWQFIAETGRRYGLEVSQYVDERRDPIKSTTAALDYLEDLYARFGSWYLAAAAYNSGENRVERILNQRAGGRRGDDALFWRIAPYLPRETRDFVPLMLAAGFVAKHPEAYGFTDLEYHPPLRFDVVEVPASTPLALVARAADVHEDVVQELNLHLVRGTSPPSRTYEVRLPVGHGAVFAANFERVREEERAARLAATVHVVRRGETLSHIARQYGVTANALQRYNGIANPRRLQIGQRIRIPDRTGAAVAAADEWLEIRVRRGDSLWAIARRHNVTVRQLQVWNNLGSRSLIRPGQILRVRA